jgi:hypothetical protein
MKGTTMSDPFENMEIICSYSWDDAIEDGTFIRIPEELSKQLFNYPMAITNTIWSKYIEGKDINGRLWDILWMMRNGKKDGNYCYFKVKLGRELVEMIAVCEARSPDNPEAILTIMLPSDR